MKKLSRIKPTEGGAQGARWHSSFRLAPTSQIVDPSHGSQPAALKAQKARAITVKGKIQNFYYVAPAAVNVQLVGDFTRWQEQPINLRKGASGTWWAAVRLERGTHYYRFLVDGQWRDDPECPLHAPNPFGSRNAVRQVN